MHTAVALPDDLAVLPPGPELASVLRSIELAQVPNEQILEVLRAQYRQLSHEQARTAAVLAEVGRCAGFPQPGEIHRLPAPDRFAAEESRAALCWTRHAADSEHDLAEAVVHRYPAVFATWLAGDIDRARVHVFDHYLTGLTEAQIANICRIAVPRAHELTTGQLAVLLRRMVIAVDPDAAARWYREGIRRRGVVAYPAADGTITLSARGLPADEAEAACTRLQELAAKAQRAGHPGLIDQIRADLYLGLLDGRFHHLTTDQLIAALIARYPAEESDRQRADEPTPPVSTTAEAAAPVPPDCPDPAASAGPASPDPAAPAGPASPDPAAPAPAEPATPGRPAGPGPEARHPQDQRVGIEIRVGLATLLGRDEHPAELPGLGLLPAPDARRRVHLQARAEWRFALTDVQGRLVFDGITRRRPRGSRRDGPPGGIVELHIPVSLLTELLEGDTAARREWADLISDIAAQYAGGDDQHADLDARPDARLPGTALRRHTEIRDRTCTYPGCRYRARAAEQDHTRDYRSGGATVRINLGPLCPHDHQVKHLGGWRVDQRQSGIFTWHSPLGGVYRISGEPFLPPLPDPAPADPGPGPGPGPGQVQPDELVGPILRRPASRHPPRRLPFQAEPDDAPPF